MYIIIGGEERCIEQVESFAEYTDTTSMSAKEIFYGARANKLFDKIVQIEVDKLAIDLANGNPIELVPIEHPNVDSFMGGNVVSVSNADNNANIGNTANISNIDRAKQLEYFYAEQATKLARG